MPLIPLLLLLFVLLLLCWTTELFDLAKASKAAVETPNIDFDAASRAWRRNKIKGPAGTFEYRETARD